MSLSYTQAARVMGVFTPLGQDALLLESLTGVEAISELFEFRLDLLADPGTDVSFPALLGKSIVVQLSPNQGETRYLTGIVSRFSQGAKLPGPLGDETFVRYRASVVPQLWLLTRKTCSRIFQQIDVPEILRQVFSGLQVKWKLNGKYEPRDYCVQYRETDFAFASRLMEEEGIYYYFEHGPKSHMLVVADSIQGHQPVPGDTTIQYEAVHGGFRPDHRITEWEKSQELRAGRVALWDHSFELPSNNLEAAISASSVPVKVGEVDHSLQAGANGKLERYDWPGGYSQRFDGIDPSGGERPKDIENIFRDSERTVDLRMQEEAARGLEIRGESTCRQLTAGHRFTLSKHFNANGDYVLTRVEHQATLAGTYHGGEDGPIYTNTFTAIPVGLPYRPPLETPKAVIHGTQTATVVGYPGEEISTDKYGRIKVQFPWDREGKRDLNSSCWVRVSQVHAGKRWGGIDVPRVGEEVIVAFEEGDPDRPIVIGRVYNAEVMPPFDLPKKKMVSGLKSNTYPGGGGSNEISMDDSADGQQMYIHAQKDQDEVVENDQTSHVKNNRTKTVDVDETTTIGNNRTELVKVDEDVTIGSNDSKKVGGNQTLNIGIMKNEIIGVMANEVVGVAKTLTVAGAMNTAVGFVSFEEVGMNKTIIVGSKFEIICGASRLVMDSGGNILLEGSAITIKGSGPVKVEGAKIDLN